MIPPLWTAVLGRLAAEMVPLALETWVHPLVARAEDGELWLSCPNVFHRERVRGQLLERITYWAGEEAGREVPVSLEVGAEPVPAAKPGGSAGAPASPTGSAPEPARAPRPAPSPRPVAQASPAPRQEPLPYRFDDFVVGPCNALAREGSLALAEGRQRSVDSLFLAADSGLGKTHLARAVVAAVQAQGTRRAIYAPAEAFTNEFQSALRSGGMSAFKRRYRGECDLLVVEDVQFFAGKQATQLEIFHTVQHLLDVGGRVVFTGDRPPANLTDFDPRLRSRMTAGLVAEIEAPDAEVRRRILRAKAAAGGVRLPDACLELLVDAIRGSVRDLEGALVQLVATASLLQRPIDRDLTDAALKKVRPRVAEGPGPVAPEDVIEVVAAFFKTTAAALASRSRRRDVLLPRQLAMYLCRRYTDASLARIGRAFDRDHPAVANAVAVIERRMLERAPARYQVEALSRRVEERTGARP
jgi:chromosomal replication initiator protein